MVGAVRGRGPADFRTRVRRRGSGHDDWIGEVKGTHRCLFDFLQHKNGIPLLHILNYINTYAAFAKAGADQVGAVDFL